MEEDWVSEQTRRARLTLEIITVSASFNPLLKAPRLMTGLSMSRGAIVPIV